MSVTTTTRRLENALKKTKKTDQTKNISNVFWINDDSEHKILYNKTNGNCCFNHQIGLPKSKILPFNEIPIFSYERDIISNIENHKDYVLNKARGIGATELILRWVLFKAIHNQVSNRKFLIITGIRQELARDYIKRLRELCTKISFVITGPNSQDTMQIKKSLIIAMPANPATIRGYENVEVIFADEAAHWDMLEDEAVLEAIEPHRTKSDPHIIIVSTPNGRRGFFANIFHNPETRYYTDYKPWNVSEGLLIDQDQVEKLKKEDYYRYEQEYNCQFLTTKYSAFPEEVLQTAEKFSEVYQLSD